MEHGSLPKTSSIEVAGIAAFAAMLWGVSVVLPSTGKADAAQAAFTDDDLRAILTTVLGMPYSFKAQEKDIGKAVVDDGVGRVNLPMDRIANLYLIGVALRDAKCSAGASVVRNALEFARQNGKSEDDVLTFAMEYKGDQHRFLTASVEASRNGAAMDETLSGFCQAAIGFPLFLGLPNRH